MCLYGHMCVRVFICMKPMHKPVTYRKLTKVEIAFNFRHWLNSENARTLPVNP